MAGSTKDLTDKERRFVELYLVYADVKKAAMEAGFSETMAKSKCYQWVSDSKVKPHVYEAVRAGQKSLSERTEITQERILQEYARIGFSDIRKTLTPTGHLMNPQDWDDDTAAAIAGIEVVTSSRGKKDDDGRSEIEYTHKIKTWDKPKALDAMAKHLGMFDGKKGVEDPEESNLAQDVRSVARDIAFLLQRAVQQPAK